MRKINFKQPKYIFPAVVFFPLVGVIYFISSVFVHEEDRSGMSDEFNTSIPEAQTSGIEDKLASMMGRYDVDDSYGAIERIGQEMEKKDSVSMVYSEDELNSFDRAAAERERVRKESEQLERRLRNSRHQNTVEYGAQESEYGSQDDFQAELDDIKYRTRARRKAMNEALGIEDPEEAEAKAKAQQEELQRKRKEEAEKNAPKLVIKSKDVNYNAFNTVNDVAAAADEPLIRAMIDKTTKAQEGTRIRFKLMDDVTVDGINLPKGTYLYGTVSGFQQQRVLAKISSILVGNKFTKVDLSVFDNDGMEGFYVPASSFRDFMKDAGSSAVQNNININSGYGSELSGESLALQALQNVYTSATSALSANIRRNKAKIKYNTIVYLINSEDARK